MIQVMKQPLPVVMTAVLAVGMGLGIYLIKNHDFLPLSSPTPVEVTPPPEIKTVTALGSLQPQGNIINVAPASTAQGTRIKELLVKQGDLVEKGQIIAVMDNYDKLQAAVLKAESEVKLAQARLAQVKAGAKQGEIEAQLAEINRLELDQQARIAGSNANLYRLQGEMENASVEYQRYEYLYQQGGIAASVRDSKKLVWTSAQRNLQQAEAELRRLQTTNSPQLEAARANLARIEEVRPVDIQVLQEEVNRALATLQQAKADLEQAMVTAPQKGTVLEILTRVGEMVAQRGILEIGNLERMSVKAEVYESDIQRVKVGQAAKVTSDALPANLEGRVTEIRYKVQPQGIVGTDPSSSIDNRVIEVEVLLDESSSAIARQFTNLQVMTTIQIEK
jgi:HlyD family secretion protein